MRAHLLIEAFVGQDRRAMCVGINSLRGLADVEAVNVVSRDDGVVRLHIDAPRGRDVRALIFGAAVQHGWTLLEMRRETVSLEDVFRQLTTTAA